jgi:hypothetical protein
MMIFGCVGVMYAGEYVCDVILSVRPHRGRGRKSIGPRDHWSHKFFQFPENISPRKKKKNLDKRINSEGKL